MLIIIESSFVSFSEPSARSLSQIIMAHPSFLGIPQEIRDDILELFIFYTDSISPPVTEILPLDLSSTHSSGSGLSFTSLQNDLGPCFTYRNLLLVSHKMNEDTVQVMKRFLSLSTGGRTAELRYKLDLIIESQSRFYASWIQLPFWRDSRVVNQNVTPLSIKSIDVNIRVAGRNGPNSQGRGRLFIGGDGGPPSIVWCFFSFLENFVRYGPSFRQRGSTDSSELNSPVTLNSIDGPDEVAAMWHIDVITLHVIPCFPIDPADTAQDVRSRSILSPDHPHEATSRWIQFGMGHLIHNKSISSPFADRISRIELFDTTTRKAFWEFQK
jgi:hypothetical protein